MKTYVLSEKYRKLPVTSLAVVVEGLLLVISLIWILVRKLPVLKDIHISPQAFFQGLLAGVLILASGAIFYILDKTFFQGKTRRVMEGYMYPLFKDVSTRDILIIALASGICEEIFFRGVLMREFGIVVSSLIFGLLHTPGKKTWFLGLWTAIIGMVMALLYKWTGNLFVPIVAHVANNMIAISYARFFHQKIQDGKSDGDSSSSGEDDDISYRDDIVIVEVESRDSARTFETEIDKEREGEHLTEEDSEFALLKREAESIIQYRLREELDKAKSGFYDILDEVKGFAREIKEEFLKEKSNDTDSADLLQDITRESAGKSERNEVEESPRVSNSPARILDPSMLAPSQEALEKSAPSPGEESGGRKSSEKELARTVPEPDYEPLFQELTDKGGEIESSGEVPGNRNNPEVTKPRFDESSSGSRVSGKGRKSVSRDRTRRKSSPGETGRNKEFTGEDQES